MNRAPLWYWGINYDTGTLYLPDADSRPDWSPALMRRHLSTIADDLHANALNIFGSHVDRLAATAAAGLDLGLDAWVQPRLPDATATANIDHVEAVAAAVEPLRAAGGAVRLNVGCELSIFTSGLIPGSGYRQRADRLRWMWPLLPVFNRRLDGLLGRIVDAVRARFGGELTYGAGGWESVSWDRFDAVGLNHYRDRTNHADYTAPLHAARRHGKPVLVTEFGCCSYPGADSRGAEGDAVVDWDRPGGAVVVGTHHRDETVQARYLTELIEAVTDAGVDGAFVFEYSEPLYRRHADPAQDLDVASFGIVAVERTDAAGGTRYTETRKSAFAQVASLYREMKHRDA